MKAIAKFLLLFTFIFSQAQVDCRPFLPTEEGTIWELTNFSAKGKPTGKIVYEIIKKEVVGTDIIFEVQYITYDKKGKEIYKGSYEAKCINGVFELDMAFKMDGSQLQAYQNMDITVDASKFELPDLDAEPNTSLADGSLKVGLESGGGLNINMTVEITDRKVEKIEELNTKAGTFKCVVLSQWISTKMLIRVQGESREWYAPYIGLVRSESYNKKGKLLGYSEITALSSQ